MTPAAFIKEIAGPARRPLYVLRGGEPRETARCLEAARRTSAPDFRDFNCADLDLEAGQADRLIGEARTRPFGPPPRVLTVKNPPFKAEDWNALADYLEDPNPETVIILALKDELDGRLRFSKKIKGEGLEVDCRPPKGAALVKWLAEELKSRGVTAEGQVCRQIIERALGGQKQKELTGDDLNILQGEAEKLSLYLEPGQNLSAGLVQDLVSLAPDANIFELGDALGRHDLKTALGILLKLMVTEDPRGALGMITRHFRILLEIKTRQAALGRTRLGPEEARLLGLPPFVLEKTQGQAAAWPWPDLTQALAALEEAYLDLVSSGAPPPQTLLENLTLKLAALGRGVR